MRWLRSPLRALRPHLRNVRACRGPRLRRRRPSPPPRNRRRPRPSASRRRPALPPSRAPVTTTRTRQLRLPLLPLLTALPRSLLLFLLPPRPARRLLPPRPRFPPLCRPSPRSRRLQLPLPPHHRPLHAFPCPLWAQAVRRPRKRPYPPPPLRLR